MVLFFYVCSNTDVIMQAVEIIIVANNFMLKIYARLGTHRNLKCTKHNPIMLQNLWPEYVY